MLILALAFASRFFGWTQFEEHIREYKFLSKFYESITALVFGLSGLRSLDKFIEAKTDLLKTQPRNNQLNGLIHAEFGIIAATLGRPS